MQTAVIVFFLAILLGLFVPAVRVRLGSWFRGGPRRIFLVPAALTVLFVVVLERSGASSLPFLLLVAAYTLVPTVLVYRARPWLDLAAIFALWLPVEFTVGRQLLPQSVWGIANITARGTAVTLALFLFLVFRDYQGMKYQAPRRPADFVYPAIGFATTAPVLIALGLALGFLGPFRLPAPFRAGAFALLFLKTLLGVAIPEELLFRGLVQNWLMQKFGSSYKALLAAALIFGAAHLNNPPGPLPNWRYMILASIAGMIYGRVFWKSSSLLSSAALHALVNSLRHTFFL
jgi:membrane protease YdiL (CAAX protease family)